MQTRPKLKKISSVITKYNIKPKKSLSQNFLFDLNLTEQIVRSMGEITGYDIVEIGPGPGSLTRSLLHLGARRVIAVEKDAQFLKPLEELSEAYPGRLKVIHNDFLLINPKTFTQSPIKVVSNLPYNIGTQIFLRLINTEIWPPFWTSLTLMFQKEVAERIVSKPKNKAYGRLSIISQWRSNASIVLRVKAESFVPIPKIDSAIVRLTPMKKPIIPTQHATLEKLIKIAFAQRRKMLRQSLKKTNKDILQILNTAGIDPTSRPEDLSIRQFCSLANLLGPF